MGHKSISPLGAAHTIISFRMAADLARKMRKEGWAVNQKLLWKSTPYKIARKIAAKNDPDSPGRIEVQICILAGLIPEVKP